ncbi:MAG: hypothetical protein KDD55_09660 [Bdellovibrionales bacterium]|nr:hypothetical protein [Bdellovibrionales bacterium]
MSHILSIDASQEPAQAVLVKISDRTVQIIEHHSLELGNPFMPPSEEKDGSSPSSPSKKLIELVKMFSHEWVRSLLIVPHHRSLSLNLELPFGTPKSINKILELEVQDLLPFSTEQFHLSPASLGVIHEGEFDVHVALTPRHYMQHILQVATSDVFEPALLTTPPSVLSAAYYLAPNYCQEDATLIYPIQQGLAILFVVDGIARAGRVISLDTKDPASLSPSDLQQAYSEIKLALAATEKRYETTFSRIYLMGEIPESRLLQQTLGRVMEQLPPSELVPQCSEVQGLATLGAVFAQDRTPPPLLENLRTGSFSYRPQLQEFISGLRKLSTPFFVTLAIVSGCLLASYWIRNQHLLTLQTAMAAQIERVIPEAHPETGKELEFVQTHFGSLHNQLKEIGSAAQVSAIQALAELSEEFSSAKSVDVKRITITGKTVTIEGNAPNYHAVDRLKNKLRKRSIFCGKIKDDTSASVSKQVGYTYTLTLCD